MLAASADSGIFSMHSSPSFRNGGQGSPLPGIQTPEKSGFPSGVLGAGAFRLARPSAIRGTVGIGYVNHCAASGIVSVDTTIAAIVMAERVWRMRRHLTPVRR